jgi:hypothetical protein
MRARSSLLLGLVIAGCGVGDATGPGGGGDDDGVDVDERPPQVLCEAQLTLTGTMTPPGTPPTADLGCVPQGEWVITATVGENDCGEVPLSGSYTYTVTGTGHETQITYGGTEQSTVGIHAGGNGNCLGSFEHIWQGEGGWNVLLLKPNLEPGTTTIDGTGTFQLWNKEP